MARKMKMMKAPAKKMVKPGRRALITQSVGKGKMRRSKKKM